MTASSRFLAWLVFPLFALSSFNLLADTVEGAPQALHLLDYISADYPPTVAAGKVVDDGEYREQLEFTQVLQGLITGLPAKPEKAALEQGVEALHAAITAKQDGAEVARQARQLGRNWRWRMKSARHRSSRRIRPGVRRCMRKTARCATVPTVPATVRRVSA